jgi:hypothetical protein
LTEEETKLWTDRNEAKLCAICVSPLEGQTYLMAKTEPPPPIICLSCKLKELHSDIEKYTDRADMYLLMAQELRKRVAKVEKKESL